MKSKKYLRDIATAIKDKNQIISKKGWLERNSILVGTVINIILIFITVGSLYQAKIATDIAFKQFNLSNDQYHDYLKSRILDSARTAKNDSISSAKDLMQNKFAIHQDSINNKQLEAIKIQALSTRQTFKLQRQTFNQQQYNERPDFSIIAMFMGKVRKDSVVSVLIQNTGIRSVKTGYKRIVGYNPNLNYFVTTLQTGGTTNMSKNNTSQIDLKMSQKVFNDERTVYYLKIQYFDVLNPMNRPYEVYFRKGTNALGGFSVESLTPSEEDNFKKTLDKDLNFQKFIKQLDF